MQTGELSETTLEEQVWTAYVQRMVNRKGNSKRYPLGHTRLWLAWLAKQMWNHNQAVFYLEHLQPDWLTPPQQRTYVLRSIRLPAIAIGFLVTILVYLFFTASNDLPHLLQIGVLGGLLGGLWHGEKERQRWGKRLVISACIGLISGLSFGLYYLSPYKSIVYNSHQILIHWQTDGPSYGVGIGLGCLLLQHFLATPFHSDASSGNSAMGWWKRLVRLFQAAQGPRALLVATIAGPRAGLGIGLGIGLNYGFTTAALCRGRPWALSGEAVGQASWPTTLPGSARQARLAPPPPFSLCGSHLALESAAVVSAKYRASDRYQ